MEAVSEALRLCKLVDLATWQNACLDNIYSDKTEYNKQTVQQLSPLIINEEDHCCIFIPSCYTKKHQYQYKTKRKYTNDTKARICEQLYHQDWSELYYEPDIHKKEELFQKMMCCIVNEICPPRKIRVRVDNPKWETDLTRKIRRARNRARQKKSKSFKYLSKPLKKLINKNKKLEQ